MGDVSNNKFSIKTAAAKAEWDCMCIKCVDATAVGCSKAWTRLTDTGIKASGWEDAEFNACVH